MKPMCEPQIGEPALRELLGVLPRDTDGPGGGGVHTADEVEQRGLPAAGRSRDGDELSREHLQRDTSQRGDLHLAEMVALGDVLDGDDGL
ncbi:hypothetical protein STIAU_7349 [Stigmatella aurantiaca DW4/3-1]|uniref:Uncharacterized protein n=1 Tax=Stigmatella aurantiaca (strain DW4/3-1) TaxID=378806 RepID=Q099Y8_STIAD|nr:hypothetical protein STIAU_7349 [Stigmatella aurantiaca DW4/3-1]